MDGHVVLYFKSDIKQSGAFLQKKCALLSELGHLTEQHLVVEIGYNVVESGRFHLEKSTFQNILRSAIVSNQRY